MKDYLALLFGFPLPSTVRHLEEIIEIKERHIETLRGTIKIQQSLIDISKP